MDDKILNRLIIAIIFIISFVVCLFESSVVFGRDYSEWLKSCESYRNEVEQILRNEGLSTDYYYLMVAESRCRDKAESKAGAQGFWQLMPSTAKSYGCNNPHDLECSTKAAAKYIKQLEDRFNTFEKVIAAYNMGGHNLRKKGISSQAIGLVRRVKLIKKADENDIF